MAHFVSQNPDGTPLYYAPKVGRSLGAGGGWTRNPIEGLAFARAVDAQTFLEYHLPYMQAIATVAEMEIPPE